MANEKELTELYSGPGAESFRVFEDENGKVRATMGRGEIVTASPSDQGIAYSDGGVPVVSGLTGFSSSVVASLVAGATASQSGNTVTVTATAHGVPTSQAGKRIYYPGSSNIAAGWYPSLAVPDANTITFQRSASAAVASESVNSGAAFTSSVTVASATVKGGSLKANGRITARFKRSGDTTAATKTLLLALDGLAVGTTAMGATAYAIGSMTFWNGGSETLQFGNQEMDGRLTNVEYKRTVDTTVDKTLALAASVSAAGGWVAIDAVEIEHVSRA